MVVILVMAVMMAVVAVEIVLLTVPAVLGVILAQVLGLMVEVPLVKGVAPVAPTLVLKVGLALPLVGLLKLSLRPNPKLETKP
jgi:hypothetical protein